MASDLFGLGVLATALVTGRPPKASETTEQRVARVRIAGGTAAECLFVEACCHSSAEDRPRNVEAALRLLG
jgi:hypothetical protein